MTIPDQTIAYVDKDGVFRCPCGSSHSRGPFRRSPVEIYECRSCGRQWKLKESSAKA